MTPEQIKQRDEAFANWRALQARRHPASLVGATVVEGDTQNAWDACWSAATAAERERCAKIALDGYLIPLSVWEGPKQELTAELGRRIAAAIRQGSKP